MTKKYDLPTANDSYTHTHFDFLNQLPDVERAVHEFMPTSNWVVACLGFDMMLFRLMVLLAYPK